MSEAHFDELYGTEALCHDALVRWRWPEGFECPDCEDRAHCIIKRGARILYQCNGCRKQTSVKAGTIFASSKLALRLWFKAMYHLTQSKNASPASNSPGGLASPRRPAWMLKHKLAQVMMERNATWRLKGDVQMDDAYIGGCGENAFRRRYFHDQRRQTRSNRPSPRRQVQQNGDRQICGHGA